MGLKLPMYVAGEQCPPTPCREWPRAKSDGYGVRNRNAFVTAKVHRQIMAMVHGEDAIRPWCVIHLCDNRPCFRYDHLRLGTLTENNDDATRKQRVPSGERHHASILTEDDVREIRRRYKGKQNRWHRNGPTLKELADEYNTTDTRISVIVNHKSWRHVQ